jgi:hypothetical protein
VYKRQQQWRQEAPEDQSPWKKKRTETWRRERSSRPEDRRQLGIVAKQTRISLETVHWSNQIQSLFEDS